MHWNKLISSANLIPVTVTKFRPRHHVRKDCTATCLVGHLLDQIERSLLFLFLVSLLKCRCVVHVFKKWSHHMFGIYLPVKTNLFRKNCSCIQKNEKVLYSVTAICFNKIQMSHLPLGTLECLWSGLYQYSTSLLCWVFKFKLVKLFKSVWDCLKIDCIKTSDYFVFESTVNCPTLYWQYI